VSATNQPDPGPLAGAPGDIAGFLGSHPPFDTVEPAELARVAAVTLTEVNPTGTTIFSQGAEPVECLWMVRAGSVEVRHDGRILDRLGPGELFGHASMISGLPTGFEARAGEDTVCYCIPAEVVRPLLARPDVLRFVARSIVTRPGVGVSPEATGSDPLEQRAATLIRTRPLLCHGSEPIREAAKRMTAEGASAVLVRTGAGAQARLGIVTDRDLRSRVIAAGLSPDAPVSAIMTDPAYTVSADRLGGDVLLDMLERGVHHIPVLSPAGQVLGVIDDGDLVAAEARRPFLLRRAIDLAASPAELAATAAGLNPVIISLHDARVTAEHVSAVRSVVLDALTRRLVDLAVQQAGPPPAPFTWFALGSLARREVMPSSDIDSALAWQDSAADAEVRKYLAGVASTVEDGLRACGIRPDANGASASSPLFARSLTSWRAVARSLAQDPSQEQALILVSVITDNRPVWSIGWGGSAALEGPAARGPGAGSSAVGGPAAESSAVGGPDGLWEARARPGPELLRLLARFALSFRPPTGFLRDFVVEHSGERRGQLDIKHGGLIPIVDLARWAGMAAGVTSASTVERLRAAEAAGTLESTQARTLMEAFGFIFSLRLDHQVEQLRRGEEPDDFIDPKTLNPLARSYLREAFRAVASVQSGLANELALGIR
jgi:CBS domain-containing protein